MLRRVLVHSFLLSPGERKNREGGAGSDNPSNKLSTVECETDPDFCQAKFKKKVANSLLNWQNGRSRRTRKGRAPGRGYQKCGSFSAFRLARASVDPKRFFL